MKPNLSTVQACFDRCMSTAFITKELHGIDALESELSLSTIYLQSLVNCKQYHTIANYTPTSDVEAYLVAYAMSQLNLPLKSILDFIKEQMIERDCDYLRLLYAKVAKDIQVLIDLKSSHVSCTWEYWHIFSLLMTDIHDFHNLKSHSWQIIGLAYTLVIRNIKSNRTTDIITNLHSFSSSFPSILLYILNLQNGNISSFDDSISNNPYLSDFVHIIANELSKLDNNAAVLSLCMQQSLEDPIHPNTKIVQAIYYSMKNMNLKSIEILTSAVENPNCSSLAHLLLGHEYFQFANYKMAVTQYLQVVRMNKKDVRGWAAIGDVYFSMGLFEQAIRHYSECATINQNDAYIYTQLGNCYEKLEIPQMWYKSVMASWKLEAAPETTLALYKSARSFGLEPRQVFDILKNAFIQNELSLEFPLLVELIEYAIQFQDVGFGRQVYGVAKEQSGWMHQSKLTELGSKLAMRQMPRAVENSPIRHESIAEYSDQNHSSVCEETPTRMNRQTFGHYELG